VSLTEKKIRKLITAGERARVADSGPNGTKGLYLCVDSERAASWSFRFQLGHKSRWMGLGSARDFSLSEARARAREQRQKLADRIDPLSARRAERAEQAAKVNTMAFGTAAESWHAMMSPRWSSRRHADDVRNRLTRWVVPLIGKIDVATLETTHVLRVLQQEVGGGEGKSFWTAHAVAASRVRGDIEQILNWCAVAGYRPTSLPNPARWAGHLALLLPAPRSVSPVQGHTAMRYQDIPALMARLAKHQSIGARAAEFLILTAGRLGEVTGAKWIEIDISECMWTLPPSRMKSRKEHKQPLSTEAIKLLQNLPREAENPFVFIGREGAALSQSTLREVMRREGHDGTTIHGFRSSFSDWAHERSAHSNIVVEMCLAHTVGSAVERSYRRSDLIQKRRALMSEWARFCTTPPVSRADKTGQQKVIGIGTRR
jgi:integrase